MALIKYSLTLVAKQDAPFNVLPDTDVSIRKVSDNSLVLIYSDSDGLIPIAQPGAKTNSRGVFEFYTDSLPIVKAVWSDGGNTYEEVFNGNSLQALSGLTEPSDLDKVHIRTFDNVSAMLVDSGLVLGRRYSTGGTVWRYAGNSTGTLEDFDAITPVNVMDFGAVSGVGIDNTIPFQAAIDATRPLLTNLTWFMSFSRNGAVVVPQGYFEVGELDLPIGSSLVGSGTSSTILKATPGASYIIRTGSYLVPSERPSAVDDRVQGKIAGMTIMGIPDPTYSPLTISERLGKHHLTETGILIDGAFNYFKLEDLLIMYCHNNIDADRSYTMSMKKVSCREATGNAAYMKGPFNASAFDGCSFLYSTVGLFLQGGGASNGGSKPIMLDTNTFEYCLYEGLKAVDTPILEVKGGYIENCSMANREDGLNTGQDVLIDSVLGGAFRGRATFRGTLFNSIAAVPQVGITQLYCKAAQNLTLDNCNFGASNQQQLANIRIGENVDSISTRLTFPSNGGNTMPILYDAGANPTVVEYDDLANGNMTYWDIADSQAVNGMESCNNFRVTNGTLTKQAFAPDQTDVPGYPVNYASFAPTGEGIVSYRVNRRDVSKKSGVLGVWVKSAVAASFQLKLLEFFAGNPVQSTTKTFTATTGWAFYSVGRIMDRLAAEGYVDLQIITSGNIDIANMVFSDTFVAPSNRLSGLGRNSLKELQVINLNEQRYGTAVFQYHTIQLSERMYKDALSVDISGLTLTNCTLTVNDTTATSVTLRALPSGAGVFGYSGKIIVKSLL